MSSISFPPSVQTPLLPPTASSETFALPTAQFAQAAASEKDVQQVRTLVVDESIKASRNALSRLDAGVEHAAANINNHIEAAAKGNHTMWAELRAAAIEMTRSETPDTRLSEAKDKIRDALLEMWDMPRRR